MAGTALWGVWQWKDVYKRQVFDQRFRIILQMSLANLCVLNRHKLGQYAQRNTALTQIGNQLILGCGHLRIWHIIAAAVREAVFTLRCV